VIYISRILDPKFIPIKTTGKFPRLIISALMWTSFHLMQRLWQILPDKLQRALMENVLLFIFLTGSIYLRSIQNPDRTDVCMRINTCLTKLFLPLSVPSTIVQFFLFW